MADVLNQGISLYKTGQYQAALEFFLALPTEAITDSLEVAYYLGLSYAKLKKYEEALLYLEQIVTSGGSFEKQSGDSAKEDLNRLYQCRLMLAVIYVNTNRVKMADFELKKLIESGYQTIPVLCGLAYIAWEQKNENLAIEYYEKALQMDENNATALNGLGYVLASTGRDLTRALFLCRKAVDIKPNSAAYLDSMGWVYFKLGLLKEANKFLKQAKDKLPENEEVIKHFNALNDSTKNINENSKISMNRNKEAKL